LDSSMELKKALENINNRHTCIRVRAFDVIKQTGEQAMPGLIAVLYERDSRRQEIAIALIWELFRERGINHPELTSALIQAIRQNEDNNPLVVMDGIGLLAALNDPRAFDDLVGFLASPNEDTREGAIEALAMLNDKKAIEHLLPMLNDPIPYIRNRAVWALGYIGHHT
jgi:HEAT repeat protein